MRVSTRETRVIEIVCASSLAKDYFISRV